MRATLVGIVAGFLLAAQTPGSGAQEPPASNLRQELEAASRTVVQKLLEQEAQTGEAELILRVGAPGSEEFYCAPECLAVLKPGGVLWLSKKLDARRVRAELTGQWAYADDALILTTPAAGKKRPPQTMRVNVNLGDMEAWLAEARQHFFTWSNSNLTAGSAATVGDRTAPLEVADTDKKNRERRTGKYSPSGLVEKLASRVTNPVRDRARAEKDAARAEADRLAAEKKVKAAEQAAEREKVFARVAAQDAKVKETLSVAKMGKPEIMALQLALVEADQDPGSPDGAWGQQSAAALRNWVGQKPLLTLSKNADANLRELLDLPPNNEIHIVDKNGVRKQTLKCNPGEALFFGGGLVPCGTQIVQ